MFWFYKVFVLVWSYLASYCLAHALAPDGSCNSPPAQKDRGITLRLYWCCCYRLCWVLLSLITPCKHTQTQKVHTHTHASELPNGMSREWDECLLRECMGTWIPGQAFVCIQKSLFRCSLCAAFRWRAWENMKKKSCSWQYGDVESRTCMVCKLHTGTEKLQEQVVFTPAGIQIWSLQMIHFQRRSTQLNIASYNEHKSGSSGRQIERILHQKLGRTRVISVVQWRTWCLM